MLVVLPSVVPETFGIKSRPSVIDTTKDNRSGGKKMAGVRENRSSRAWTLEVGAGIGLSAAFLVLAVVFSPVAAAAVAIPASLALGLWRAHTLPRRTPHSLSVPVFQTAAVIRAPKVSSPSAGTDVTTAA